METDKNNHPPEKSTSFVSREAQQDNKHDDTINETTDSKPDEEHQKENDTENTTLSETPKEDETKPETDEAENKVEEEEEEEEEDPKIEESNPPPPDFDEVCKEIDQFISTLSGSKDDQFIPPDVPEVIEQFAFLVEAKIANYDPTENPIKWTHQLSQEDSSSSFLQDVDRVSKLSTSLNEFSNESKFGPSINRIGSILQRAMSYLEDEFRSLLEDPKIHPDHSSDSTKQETADQQQQQQQPLSDQSAVENNFPGYSDEVVLSLNKIAKAMIKGGYETECLQVYIIARRNVLEETLHKLGFEKFSIDDIQKMQWEPLEREIDSWNKMFKECVTVHFTGERKLSATVFSSSSGSLVGDDPFSRLSRSIMIQLLNFAEAVAMTKRSSEKLFKFLDIYETLRDLIPTMDDLFPDVIVKELKSEATLTRCRLGEAMVHIFCELENSIKADMGKTPVPGGAVHPLSRYTMNYLKYACEYKDTLEQVFREHQKIDRADSATGSDYDYKSQSQGGGQSSHSNQTVVKQSPFTLQINKVMELLDTNLDTKSKLYKDTSLSQIFMMNNGRYILQKIKGSAEIHELMGDTWSRKRSSELRQYHKNYQRETWGRLLNCLNHEGLNVNGKVVKPVLKEKFKSFNAMFDEIHRTQSAWIVSDEQLQSELRVSISAVVIPAYRSFLARFSQSFTPGRQTEKYIKFQAEDIETCIDELFDGNATPTGRRRP